MLNLNYPLPVSKCHLFVFQKVTMQPPGVGAFRLITQDIAIQNSSPKRSRVGLTPNRKPSISIQRPITQGFRVTLISDTTLWQIYFDRYHTYKTLIKDPFALDDNDVFFVIFSCRQVWTVTLVTMQTILKVVLPTWKACVVVAMCERVLRLVIVYFSYKIELNIWKLEKISVFQVFLRLI